MKFTWKWCDTCDVAAVICPKCGNNCCNGGYGKQGSGDCDVCELAYQFQYLAYAAERAPTKEGLEHIGGQEKTIV